MNKKRNTFIVFETLLREHSDAYLKNDAKKYNGIKGILDKYFAAGTELSKEVNIFLEILDYKDNYKNKTEATNKQVFDLAKEMHKSLDKKKIFNEQSKLIEEVSAKIGKNVFSNFLPEYKILMNMYSYLTDSLSIKENISIDINSFFFLVKEQKDEQLEYVDNIVFTKLIEKYNEKYKNILPCQKKLLEKYVLSYGENIADLLIYISEEVNRVKKSIESIKSGKVIEYNDLMKNKVDGIFEKLDNIKYNKNISVDKIEVLLKCQQLAQEISNEN